METPNSTTYPNLEEDKPIGERIKTDEEESEETDETEEEEKAEDEE